MPTEESRGPAAPHIAASIAAQPDEQRIQRKIRRGVVLSVVSLAAVSCGFVRAIVWRQSGAWPAFVVTVGLAILYSLRFTLPAVRANRRFRRSLAAQALRLAVERRLHEETEVDLSFDQIRIASQALNAILNGPEAIPEWEFHSRVGATRDEAEAVLDTLSAAYDRIQRPL